MQFDIITIFPHIFDSYFSESIVKRAQKNNLVGIKIHNLRDWAKDKHRTVDDTPYGGGAGMVLKIEPIHRAVSSVISNFSPYGGSPEGRQFPRLPKPGTGGQAISNKNPKSKSQKQKARIILFSAKGKKYTQKDARRLAKYDQLILICGRYEGVDERVVRHIADEEVSIGDYVLTGGEIPAMVMVDSVTRLFPGVLGNAESLKEESHSQKGILEYEQYTKPAEFMRWKVPKILLSGDHKKIKEWRAKNA